MNQNTHNKVAWITGAGTGIGKAAAIALANAGFTVALSSRQREPLQAVVDEIKAKGRDAHAFPLDVTDAPGVIATAGEIEGRLGPVAVLVNSAGVNIPARSWSQLQVDGWRRVVDINLTGTFLCMHAVAPAMRARRSGLIINIASWAGRHPTVLVGPAYNVTKHAVAALTHTFNMEECRNNLRASVIMPGETDTPILSNRPVPVPAEERARMLQEEDLGQTIAFVATMPERVCLNEILMSPTHNRAFVGFEPLPATDAQLRRG